MSAGWSWAEECVCEPQECELIQPLGSNRGIVARTKRIEEPPQFGLVFAVEEESGDFRAGDEQRSRVVKRKAEQQAKGHCFRIVVAKREHPERQEEGWPEECVVSPSN